MASNAESAGGLGRPLASQQLSSDALGNCTSLSFLGPGRQFFGAGKAAGQPQPQPQNELRGLRQDLTDFSQVLQDKLQSLIDRQEELFLLVQPGQTREDSSNPYLATDSLERERPVLPDVMLEVSPPTLCLAHLPSESEAAVTSPPGYSAAGYTTDVSDKGVNSDSHENSLTPRYEYLQPDLQRASEPKRPSRRSSRTSAGSDMPLKTPTEAESRRQLLTLRLEAVRSTVGESVWKVMESWMDWWLDIQEPERDTRLFRLVNGKAFNLLCTAVIAANSAVIVYNTNHEAANLAENNSPVMRVINAGFVFFYSMELILKLLAHRQYYFCNSEASWNWFDFVLVTIAIIDLLFSEVFARPSSFDRSANVNVSHMRAVRSIRILRAAKVFRMLRLLRFFSELRVLLSSVLHSVISLFWAIVMLMFMFFIFALIFVQGATIAQMSDDGSLSPSELESLQEGLGSTQAGILMLFQSTTGGEDWGRYYQIVRLTGEWNSVLFLFFIAFAQFALLNILTGIFVENAMKLAEPDRDTAALMQRKQELSEAEELRRLCESMDVKRSGYISEEQFLEQLQSDQLRARLALLGLDIKHAALFFDVICQDFGRKEVEIESFVSGAMRLKGTASALDLQALTFGTKLIHENQLKFFRSFDDRLAKIWKHIGQVTK